MDFDTAIELIIDEFEGGLVNDAQDPGGETKYGISQRAYPTLDIPSLTIEEAKEIYKADYWYPAKCDQLPERLVFIHFDTAVNAGVGRAIRILQKAAGVNPDGIYGPITAAAAQEADLYEYAKFRAYHYINLILRKPWAPKYARGWIRRVILCLKFSNQNFQQ